MRVSLSKTEPPEPTVFDISPIILLFIPLKEWPAYMNQDHSGVAKGGASKGGVSRSTDRVTRVPPPIQT